MVLSGDGAPKNSEQWLDNDNRTHLVLASGKLAQKKKLSALNHHFLPLALTQ